MQGRTADHQIQGKYSIHPILQVKEWKLEESQGHTDSQSSWDF